MDIDQRALDLAKHLLDIETKSKIRKNKRSPSDIDKFIKSTQWLSLIMEFAEQLSRVLTLCISSQCSSFTLIR